MKRNIFLKITLLVLVISCSKENKIVPPPFLGINNLKSQIFTIDNSVDNIITGKNGTRFRITRNTFTNLNGDSIKGEITLELKEAITPTDIVLGNLTTTYQNSPLQTGGMIYFNATKEDDSLLIASNMSISVLIPTDSVLKNMSFFEGFQDSINRISWLNPKPISQSKPGQQDIINQFEVSHNLKYYILLNNEYTKDYPDSIDTKVSEIAWEGTGLKILADTIIKYGKYDINFIKQDELTTWTRTFSQGTNSYITDYNLSYIFTLKKLGWANIDKLYNDERTEDVSLNTTFINQNEFPIVQTTLVTESMYLPGYQKKDSSFGFTHGDYESTRLPLGAKATIIGSSKIGSDIYFGFKTFIIAKNQNINIDLVKSSKQEIEKALDTEL